MSPLARATSLVQRPGALASDPTFPARTAWSRRSRPFLPVPSARPSLPARAARPPLHLPRLPCWRPAGRPRRGAPRARLPEEGWRLPGVYSCPSAAAGLSRVLGRRSAPGSGNNCGPGVRQPSSRDRGPGAGALRRRPGTRAAEGSPVASGGRAPSEDRSGVGPTASELDAAAGLPARLRKLRRRAAHAHGRRRRLLGSQQPGAGKGDGGPTVCSPPRGQAARPRSTRLSGSEATQAGGSRR